jgi:hypothetical protein
MNRTYHSRQTKHINPDRQKILISFICLNWYVLSIWNEMFCLSGMMCFVYLDWYVLSLDWYVLSIWNDIYLSIWIDMFCPPDRQNISFQIDKNIIPDRQYISIQIDKTYQSRQTKHINPDKLCFVYLEWYIFFYLD